MKDEKEMHGWLARWNKVQQRELQLWREAYPHRAAYIQAQAAAEIDGREPIYPAPIAIG